MLYSSLSQLKETLQYILLMIIFHQHILDWLCGFERFINLKQYINSKCVMTFIFVLSYSQQIERSRFLMQA